MPLRGLCVCVFQAAAGWLPTHQGEAAKLVCVFSQPVASECRAGDHRGGGPARGPGLSWWAPRWQCVTGVCGLLRRLVVGRGAVRAVEWAANAGGVRGEELSENQALHPGGGEGTTVTHPGRADPDNKRAEFGLWETALRGNTGSVGVRWASKIHGVGQDLTRLTHTHLLAPKDSVDFSNNNLASISSLRDNLVACRELTLDHNEIQDPGSSVCPDHPGAPLTWPAHNIAKVNQLVCLQSLTNLRRLKTSATTPVCETQGIEALIPPASYLAYRLFIMR
ncbi:hypothetical protein GWK47_046599 [Chionoecetes opilio]|uniref:Uncharacterized protein n=1 Tax=Chionoecetes opilio TaxID=41210 RepID=A0A8J5CWA8_CHIOP|nr:hypothetical protein GWK47_046599 [Chionoecetes opilio]